MARPLKRIEAFTLSPFSRNLRALRNFVLKSLTSIVGLKRTSLMLITFCFYELHGLSSVAQNDIFRNP